MVRQAHLSAHREPVDGCGPGGLRVLHPCPIPNGLAFFRTSGEPLSPAKARIIAAAHCTARCHYAMAEIGRMGAACGRPSTYDGVHVVADKVAFAQREISLVGGARVPAVFLTTLHWSVPKLMLNVELGDCAIMERRSCGCIWDRIGFTGQLHTIRSYEKLTSEGMHFVGADLIALVDEVLPARLAATPPTINSSKRSVTACRRSA